MECFDNIIGLKGVCDTPTTNLFLNTVGVSKADCDNIVTKDYANVEAFVNEKVDASTQLIANTVNARYSKDYVTGKLSKLGGRHYQTASIVEGVRLGIRQNNQDEKTATGIAGIHLAMNNTDSYLRLNITEVSLYLKHSGVVPVFIYDLYENRILYTENITAITGQTVKIYPNLNLDSFQNPVNLLIGYDAGAITSYNTVIRSGACCGDYFCRQQFMTSQGAQITEAVKIQDNLTGLTHTAGVSVVYSVSCNHSGWLCNHLEALSLPILYKTASEIMLHGLHASPTQRANNTQTLNRELMQQRHEHYENKYVETFEAIVNSLVLPQDPRCFACVPSQKHVISLP